MKKIISLMTAATLISSITLMSASAEDTLTNSMREKASQADFTSDGRITTDDVMFLMKYWANNLDMENIDEDIEKTGDIDGSGAVNGMDAYCLLRYVAEITLPGDVNEDGHVNSADASYLLKYIASYDESSVKGSVMESRCFNFGDINGDGKMTPADASLILAYSAELASDETLTLADFLAARNS